MNIHAPERQQDETFAGYKERRLTSKAIYKESQRGQRLAAMDPKLFFVTPHHCSVERKARRDQIALMGARQYKRLTKRMKREKV